MTVHRPCDDNQPPVILYTYAMSPFAAKVHCFLLYKQLDFDCFYISPLQLKRYLPVGHQIPVLSVGEESRADSTPIGLWLDDLFPDCPRLLPEDPERRARLVEIDQWVTQRLIPGSFRAYPGEGINRVLNAWKLSAVMGKTAHGGIPSILRLFWPLIISRVRFVREQVAMTDLHLPLQQAKYQLYREFEAHLGEGPYLGGEQQPSLPDLAAYPQFALYTLTGFNGANDYGDFSALTAWLQLMGKHLRGTPSLLPPVVIRQQMP